jgi:Uncharacterized conserved protein
MEQGINEAYKFLKDCGTYYLATVKDGLPALRPFGTVNIYQDKLYIQTSSKKEVYQEMIQNPHVAICGFKNRKWIRISAEVVYDNDYEAKKSLLEGYPGLNKMYQADDDKTAVFYLKNATVRICSFVSPEVIYKF